MFGRDDEFMNNNNSGLVLNVSLEFIGFITFIVFLILKLTGTWVEISWFWVFFPLWFPLAIDLVLFLIVLVVIWL